MVAVAKTVQKELAVLLPADQGALSALSDSMRYSALGGGKRLRPFLVMESAAMFNVPTRQSVRVAVAVELIHCYSLVHDDLPAMDNDDLRRGEPTNHKIFGEATAILAGDGLLTLAFEILNRPDAKIDSKIRCQLSHRLAQAAGMAGMIGGQAIDLHAENHSLNLSEITRLQQLKTGSLFGFCVEAGTILGSATSKERAALAGYAQALGLAFQITDDLLDVEGNQDKIGKSVRKDDAAGKATFVSLLGVAEARSKAQTLIEQSIASLTHFNGRAELLRDVAQFVVSRNH